MPNLNHALAASHQRAIGAYHHSQAYYTEKENQNLLNKLATSPASPNKHALATNLVHVITLLSLVSNSTNAEGITYRNGSRPRHAVLISPLADEEWRRVPSATTTPPLIAGPHDLADIHAAEPALTSPAPVSESARRLFSALGDAIKNGDILPRFPAAAAHVVPNVTPPRPPEPPAINDVTVEKIDFSCAKQRERLSLSQIIRQVGKTLENPIKELAQESQVIHYFNTLRQGCVPETDRKKLNAITQRADSVLTTIIMFIPYANPLVIAKNIGGPLLQLIADDMEGRPIDKDNVNDIAEQIFFLAKSTVEFSPSDAHGNKADEKLALPENIYVKNNKIFTTIENDTWQLVAKEHAFLAIGNGQTHKVTYSSSQKTWRFTPPREAAPEIDGANNRAHITDAKDSAQPMGDADQAPAPMIQRATITRHEDAPRMEERLLKSDDPPAHASNTYPIVGKPVPQRLTAQQRKKIKEILQKIASMGRESLRNAGGLRHFALTNDIPLKLLRRYIKPDASLTQRGERLLHPTAKSHSGSKPDEKTKTGLAGEHAPDGAAASIDASPAITPHAGISKLIARHVDAEYKITLLGNVGGVTSPLIYNLEQDVFYLAAQSSTEEWIRISDIPYIAEESNNMLSVLPESERGRTVTHEQRIAALTAMGSHLDLIALKKHMAQPPERSPIPRRISSIWVGDKVIPYELINNLSKNVQVAQLGPHPYTFTLYLSRHSDSAFSRNVALLQGNAPNLQIVALENTAFYHSFKQSKYFEQYQAAIEGNGGVATNFASASDSIRFQLLKREGGIYLDVDDTLTRPPSTLSLKATPSGFVLHTPMHNELLDMTYQYPTSAIGSHKENPVLDRISDAIYHGYQQNKDLYSSRPAVDDVEAFSLYAKRLSALSGPGVFDTIIRQHCFEENQVLEAYKLFKFPLDKITHGDLHDTFTSLYLSDVVKITDIVEVGSENSWQHSR